MDCRKDFLGQLAYSSVSTTIPHSLEGSDRFLFLTQVHLRDSQIVAGDARQFGGSMFGNNLRKLFARSLVLGLLRAKYGIRSLSHRVVRGGKIDFAMVEIHGAGQQLLSCLITGIHIAQTEENADGNHDK